MLATHLSEEAKKNYHFCFKVRTLYTHECKQCYKMFESTFKKAKYCCDDCYRESRKK